ncbi:MAG: zinc ribbon domain-containing protein [Bacteroidota bacterium]
MAKDKISESKVTKPAVEDPEIVTTTSAMDKSTDDSVESIVKKKLVSLYSLQMIDAQVDKIRIIRGELPLEVQDLEDEIQGLETRVNKYKQDISDLEMEISGKQNAIKESQELLKKYEAQQMNVRNNREYDSLSKEIEYQNLEMQLAEKKIREFQNDIENKQNLVDVAFKELQEREKDLDVKQKELEDIVRETQKEEDVLKEKSRQQESKIEERLLSAYKRIRDNARNGLAVVPVERDACGGCFNKIPPQRQLDIRLNKKIIVCEYCGRILLDPEIVQDLEI